MNNFGGQFPLGALSRAMGPQQWAQPVTHPHQPPNRYPRNPGVFTVSHGVPRMNQPVGGPRMKPPVNQPAGTSANQGGTTGSQSGSKQELIHCPNCQQSTLKPKLNDVAYFGLFSLLGLCFGKAFTGLIKAYQGYKCPSCGEEYTDKQVLDKKAMKKKKQREQKVKSVFKVVSKAKKMKKKAKKIQNFGGGSDSGGNDSADDESGDETVDGENDDGGDSDN